MYTRMHTYTLFRSPTSEYLKNVYYVHVDNNFKNRITTNIPSFVIIVDDII